MNGMKYLPKILVIVAICLLTLPSFHVALGETLSSEKSDSKAENVSTEGETTHFQNCKIIVSGRCNTVIGPLTWIFGFYCPLLKRNFIISANGGETEALNVLIFGGGNLGAFYNYENIIVDLRKASGVLYWFGKSLIFEGNRILAFCSAQDIYVTI